MKTLRPKLLPIMHAISLISCAPSAFAAANFLFTPSGIQPSVIAPGETVTANYTLTNMTGSARNNYHIAGLPAGVTQDTTGSNCQLTINLAAHASCPLVFNITNEVHSSFSICKGNSCTTASTPLDVTLLTTGRMIAGGTYCNQSTCAPLLAQSLGSTWSYPASILDNVPPAQYSAPTFLGASCTGSLCIAVGGDVISSGFTPFVAMSLSEGDNWTYPIGTVATWPSDINISTGLFRSGACADNTWCIAAGDYVNSNARFPMLAQYLNGSWSYVIDSTHMPPPVFLTSHLYTASCSGQICIAGGTFEDNTNAFNYLLLAQSTDHGTSWQYAIDNTTPMPANFANTAQFNGSSCSGTLCVAVGQYNNGSNQFYPVIAQTTNSGGNYSYVLDLTHGPVPTAYVDDGAFNSASCSGQLCVAGGFYNANPGMTNKRQSIAQTADGGTHYNLLAQTIDGGNTWTIPIDATHGVLPIDFSTAANGFSAVSCSGQVCVAAGSYTALSTVNYPYLAQTTNGGQTWTTIVDSTHLLPPNFVSNGNFYTASCLNNTCFAAGFYNDNTTRVPVLIKSTNGGAWQYEIDNSASTLPTLFASNGGFFSSSIGTPSNVILKPYIK